MHDGRAMCGIERGRDLDRAVERVSERQRSSRDPLSERFPVQKLHDQVRHEPVPLRFAIGTDVVEGADVRMTEAGDDAGFTLEALARGFIDRGVREEHLDRDDPAEPGIVGAVDLAHAAAANTVLEAVRTELCAGQILVRPVRNLRYATGLEKVIRPLVRVEQLRNLLMEPPVLDTCLGEKPLAFDDRQIQGLLEDVSHTPPFVGTL